MRNRGLTALSALTVIVSFSAIPVRAADQSQAASSKSTSPAKGWTPSRTADGQPDIQGVWSNNVVVPLERPVALTGKAFLTDEELKAVSRHSESRNTNKDRRDYAPGMVTDVSRAYNGFWRAESDRPINRTSLIMDPPDGRVPPVTAAAAQRFAAYASRKGMTGTTSKPEGNLGRGRPAGLELGGIEDGTEGGVDGRGTRADNPEDRPLGERCITRGLIRLPGGNNPYFEIVQGRGYVAIHAEMGNEVRIIPLDGRPHAPASVEQWLGDSRGRWEGNTLVIDTTNLTDKAPFRGSFEGLHVVERLTRVDQDTINYEVTLDDPSTWTRYWTFAYPWTNVRSAAVSQANNFRVPEIFEYACHEGNYSMLGILGGTRAAEKNAPKTDHK